MEQTQLPLPELAIMSLAGHIDSCFTEAQSHKQNITERLIACERQRRGEYEPRLRAQIDATGGQAIFMMITDIKCRAADSWIKDVLLNHAESTWALENTAEPTLPPELAQEATQVVMQEAAEVASQGMEVAPDAMMMRQQQIVEEVTEKVKSMAVERVKRMETRILDKLQEGNWKKTQNELIYDFTTYPASFMKGPVLRKKPVMRWGPNFVPIVEEQIVLEVDRVSPYDIFPGPSAVSIQDSYLIHRHRLARKALRQMKGLPGSDDNNISMVLQQFPSGFRTNINGDSERDNLEGRLISTVPDGLIECLEYWGPASGRMLKEWGLVEINGEPIDIDDEYQINAWKIAGYVIRCVMNPDPLGERPYSKACFEEIPGAFWGTALGEMMADVQLMCNAAARALANNMGLASGPQVEVQIDRLPPGTAITNMYPFKLWQTTTDRSGNGQPAIRFFQPAMNANELLGVYRHFAQIADEVTGVPNYIYGSSNVSGAGRTASGLSMLMENAAKGIKHAIMGLDAAASEVIKRIYNHLMLHDPDTSIKGDMQIVAAGAIGAMIREQKLAARQDFMARTLNPVDAPIIGPVGRAYMLRETAKELFPDVSKIIPDPDKLAAQIQAQQQQAAQQAAMQPQPGAAPGGPPPQGPGGPPAMADGGAVGGGQHAQMAALEQQLGQIEDQIRALA